MIFISCDSNNISETHSTTSLVTTNTITTEAEIDDLTLHNEVNSLNISGDTIVEFNLTESYFVVGSYSETDMYINVYDILSGNAIYNIQESFSDFYVYWFDVSDDFLVYIGRDMETDIIFVKRYSFNEEELISLQLDDISGLNTSENPIQIDNNNILVNLSTGYQGQGYTYLIDAETMSISNLVTSYDINAVIMDGTFELIYGGANRIMFNQIVMSSYNYVDTYNQVDIYNLNDLSLVRTLSVNDDEEEVCNVLHAQLIDSYISLKSICSNNVNKFVIYSLQNDTEAVNIVLPYLIDDYKIIDINDEYVLITNGNDVRVNSKVLVYNRLTEETIEINPPTDNLDFFGATSYLIDNQVLIINHQSLYIYNLEDQEYLKIEDDYQINQVHGIYNNHLIFYGKYEQQNCIFSYHIGSQAFNLIQDIDTSSFMVKISNDNISIYTYEEDINLNIYH
jgi:hypothetical protein